MEVTLLRYALEKTAPQLAKQIDANWIESQWKKRGAQAALFRRYAQGDHDAKMTSQMKAMLRVKENDAEIDDFTINYCNLVIEKPASRTHVQKFDTGNDEANEWVQSRMDASRFMATEGMLYRGAIRDASSFAIIDPVTLTYKVEPAFDGYSGVVVIYDNDGLIQWAAKIWHEATGELSAMPGSEHENQPEQESYIIVYEPERMTAWKDDGILEAYPFWNGQSEMPWRLGRVPVFQFVHHRDAYNYHGESKLRGVIPLSNVLNRTLHSIGMVEELGAFPVNVIIGAALDIGAITPGSVISLPLTDASGNVVTNPNEKQVALLNAIKHFTLQPADLDKYLNALEKFVIQIAQITGTPIHGVTSSGNLSGEALKQLEIEMTASVIRFQRENTDTWREMIFMLRDIWKQYQAPGVPPAPNFDSVSVVWESPELRDKKAELESLINLYEKMPGIFPDDFYRQKIGALMDIKESQIAQLAEQAQAEKMDDFQNLITGGGGEGGIPLV